MGVYKMILFLFGMQNLLGYAQVEINTVSAQELSIWSSDELYIYEFYIKNLGNEGEYGLKSNSINENSSLKIGDGNLLITASEYTFHLCKEEEKLIQLFFKHEPNTEIFDTIEIEIFNENNNYLHSFWYEKQKEDLKSLKIFQTNFTNYLILDLGAHSANELILYDETRLNYEHITSRSRFLDLSFLEKGNYILEMNDEEYKIQKH